MEGSARDVRFNPRIYFHRYHSGLGFWRVARTPVRWAKLSDEEKLFLHAAHTFVARLNNERMSE